MLEALSGIYCGPPPVPATLWRARIPGPVLLAALGGLALAAGRPERRPCWCWR